MDENRRGMGKILATPRAGWKKRSELDKDIGQNKFLAENDNSIELNLAVKAYCICQKIFCTYIQCVLI